MTGAQIIVRALEEPIRQLAYNAGLEASVVVDKGRPSYGFGRPAVAKESRYRARRRLRGENAPGDTGLVVGDSDASLVWIVLAASILGWLLGIAASVAFRLSDTTPARDGARAVTLAGTVEVVGPTREVAS
jgi:hypothetical protein